MSFFKTSPKRPAGSGLSDVFGKVIKSPIPVEHFDMAKRYDIHCLHSGEYRLYENVRMIAVKTLDDIRERGLSPRGFLEVEASDGTRAMIPILPIGLICEHGTKPVYVVLRKTGEPATH